MKLHRNWIINEVARAGEHTNERTYVRTYSHTYVRDRPYIPSTTLLCEGIINAVYMYIQRLLLLLLFFLSFCIYSVFFCFFFLSFFVYTAFFYFFYSRRIMYTDSSLLTNFATVPYAKLEPICPLLASSAERLFVVCLPL